jgi:putative flippase GtrA
MSFGLAAVEDLTRYLRRSQRTLRISEEDRRMIGTDDPRPTGEGMIALPTTEWPPLGTTDVDRLVQSALGRESFSIRRTLTKFFRYGATSVIALGISEVALLIASALGVTATLAAVIGNLAGTVPSYLMSRYWIWSEAPRERVGKQVVQYWMISLVSMAITSLSTGAISSAAPSVGADHLIAVGGGFFAVNFLCWVGKYVVYQKLVFVEAPRD